MELTVLVSQPTMKPLENWTSLHLQNYRWQAESRPCENSFTCECVAKRSRLCLIQKLIFHFLKRENVTVDEAQRGIGPVVWGWLDDWSDYEPVPEVLGFVSFFFFCRLRLLCLPHGRLSVVAAGADTAVGALMSTLTRPQSKVVTAFELNTWHLWWSHSV